MHTRDATCVRTCRVYRECAIDITTRLIELYSLPGILCGLTNARTLNNALVLWHVLGIVTIALHVLAMDVPLNLILTESQW